MFYSNSATLGPFQSFLRQQAKPSLLGKLGVRLLPARWFAVPVPLLQAHFPCLFESWFFICVYGHICKKHCKSGHLSTTTFAFCCT